MKMKELLMGNEAAALGALAAGVQVAAGYPGTPSTEVLETLAKRSPGGLHAEWSVNEKAAMEAAAGASYAGARTLVTMKQVGLNVASDPLMCVNYVGIKGGMVVYVADDPGPISSQTEQDTRRFAAYAKIPVFDCTSPEEAFEMMPEAYAYSEKYKTPVIFRSTTRICHSCAVVDVPQLAVPGSAEGFVKDSRRWVIFPRLSYENKKKLVARERELADDFSSYGRNEIIGNGPFGIACGGVSYAYAKEAILGKEELFTVFKVCTPYPFPDDMARSFLSRVEKAAVFEELDPVIEDSLISLNGREEHRIEIAGKRTDSVPCAGELSAEAAGRALSEIFGTGTVIEAPSYEDRPPVPVRPPVLCAGCPHRASFLAVKKAAAGLKANFCGDIGCYTLGNAAPLDMVDTCLCMGAGVTVAQGFCRAEPDTVNFSFIGDSTFFASGITGVVNAVYNKADIILIVLDNSTTAMTGHQPHPGTGITLMGDVTEAVSIEAVLKGIGVGFVKTVDPLDLKKAVSTVQEAINQTGVRAIIFKSPCIAIVKHDRPLAINTDKCIGCRKCIRELGCPAMSMEGKHAVIDATLCTGCGLCSQVCPAGCIGKEEA